MKTLREYIDLVEGNWFKKQPDDSFIPDEVYNKISAYVKQNFPHHEISGLGRNDKGQIKFQVYDPKNNQHVTNLVWTGDLAEEGIVDTVRKANYKRLAKRSFDKAYDAHQDALDSPKTPAERRSARAKFNKQYDKGTARMKKADELEENAADDVVRLAKEMRK